VAVKGGYTYVEATRPCSGKAGPRILAVRGWLASVDPGGHTLGTYVCRGIAGSGEPSVHGSGRATDWAPSTRVAGDHLADVLTRFPDGGDIQLVIWWGRQWGGHYGPAWGPYRGLDAHTSHLHIETRSWA